MSMFLFGLVAGALLPLIIHAIIANLFLSFGIALVITTLIALFANFNVRSGSTIMVVFTAFVMVVTYYLGTQFFGLK